MARTMGDLRLLDQAVARWDQADPMAVPLEEGEAQGTRQKAQGRKHVAFFEDDGSLPVTPETRVAVRTAAEALVQAGFVVDEYRPPALVQAGPLWDGSSPRSACWCCTTR